MTRDPARIRRIGTIAAALSGGLAAMILFAAWEPTVVLGAVVVALLGVLLVLRPNHAIVAVIFLLYINAPAVAVQHGVPRPVAGALILLLCIPLLHRTLVLRERIRFDAVVALMLAFMGAMFVSSLVAVDSSVALSRVIVFGTEGLLLYWLVVNCVTSLPSFRRLVWSMLAAGAFLASLTVFQAVTRSYDQQFGGFAERNLEFEFKRESDAATGAPTTRMYRSDRADGPLIGANRYAQILLVLIPLAALAARTSPGRGRRALAFAAGGLILAALALTYSRGGLLALAVVAWCAPYVGWLRRRHVTIAAVAAVILLPLAAPALTQRITSLGEVRSLDDPRTDGSLRGRATEMLAALYVFADHPVIGVGPGQYAPFYSVDYQQIPEIRFRDIQKSRRAHSLYLEMAAELGAIGFLLFMTIPIFLMRNLAWAYRRNRGVRPYLADIAAALLLSLAGFFAMAMFMSHAFERYYWLLIATAGAALHIIRWHEANDAARGGFAHGHGAQVRRPPTGIGARRRQTTLAN